MDSVLEACGPCIQAHLAARIQDSLTHFLYDNAKWLAERLVAMSASEANIYTLALVYFRSNQAYRSYHLLKNAELTMPAACYLLAQCCVQLGRLHEAREALTRFGPTVPGGAAGRYLLAQICRMSGGSGQEARQHYLAALRLDPLMWAAYEELCAMGADEEAAEACSLAAQAHTALQQGDQIHSQIATNMSGADTAPSAQTGAGGDGPGRRARAAKPAPARDRPPASHSSGAGLLAGASTTPVRHMMAMQHDGAAALTASGEGIGSGWALPPPASAAGWEAAPAPLPGLAFTTPSTGGECGALPGSGAMAVDPTYPSPCLLACTPSTESGTPESVGGGGAALSLGAGVGGNAGVQGPGAAARKPATDPGVDVSPHSDQDGGIAYATPALPVHAVAPPAPPRKHHGGSEGQGFPGFAAGPLLPDSDGRAAGRASVSDGSGPTPMQFSLGEVAALLTRGTPAALPAANHRATRLPVDDGGKVRKVGSRSLFADGTSSSAGAGPDGNSAGGGSSPARPGMTNGRRSSRLAALAGLAGASGSGSPPSAGVTRPGSARAAGGRAGAGGARFQAPYGQAEGMDAAAHVHAQPGGPDGAGDGWAGREQPQQQQQQQLQQLPGSCDWDVWDMPRSAGPRASPLSTAQGQAACLALLWPAYDGTRHMAMHRHTEALAAFQRLRPSQRRTAWVHCQLGRAYMERLEYSQAAAAFETALQLDRVRVEGMERYSTVLWHLRRDMDLSALAQAALATDRMAPQAWCVVGNLFSLHRDHDVALRLFERAIQLDPTFTYAYTLSGHEYAASDELDKALTCYQNALRVDPRHYNATYGMGCVYFRQEKYDLALCHFRSAAIVFPSSSVLQCYVGMALARQGATQEALAKLQEAVALDPRNPLAHYEAAGLLAAAGDLEGALAQHHALAHIAPGEASVYLQMGRLYKRLGQVGPAQQALELALSFNSSASDGAAIKAAIDKLHLTEEQQEEEL